MQLRPETYVILGHKGQKQFHIETYKDFRTKEENGWYFLEAHQTFQECWDRVSVLARADYWLRWS